LIIIRDIAFLRLRRFGEIRRNNPGLTARVLSRRLRQLVAGGLLKRSEKSGVISYTLTSKGEDAVYILLALLRYGIRHHMNRKEDYDIKDAVRELHYEQSFREGS
jgi:DNA-binding HxlR family transcriptional regulator